MKYFGTLLYLASILYLALAAAEDETLNRRGSKILPVFQVVRFPNDPCTVTGGSKNGTCYTAEECSNRGGTNAGSCASGFGVCCTFSLNCGDVSSENGTYFETPTTVNAGPCSVRICKASSNICQIRLDFQTFVITGPTTVTLSIGKISGGANVKGAGVEVGETGQCLTDLFTISNQHSVPAICGTNTGFHVYFDASDACNSLDFQLGNTAKGVTALATRSWSIKVNQYNCGYENLAPSGCTQYFFGTDATNYVKSFNYGTGSNRHLANQRQTVCVRQEAGKCQICWFADAAADVGYAGAGATIKVAGKSCCNYGTKASKVTYVDCLMIPGAMKNDAAGTPVAVSNCGSSKGIATASTSTTICSKSKPFRLQFNTDNWEMYADPGEVTKTNAGFKIRYIQNACA